MQNQRELSTFALAPRHRARLTSAGFLTVEDVKDLKPTELAKEVKISPDEALEILTIVQESSKSSNSSGQPLTQTVSALDLLSREDALQPIITFSEQLDAMLGGGIPLCKTTEFCGAPGVGKTQVCLQLAVDVQIPAVFGGVEGEAVYIDTEGSFIVERLVDIATATVDHCQQIASLDANPGQVEVMKRFDLQSVLSGVHYYRCHDYIQLLATVHLLPEFIQKHPKVRLVIVDSIAFHFRHGFDDLAMRTRLLTGMAQSFIKLANKHKLAVVLTNQMTTKIGGGAQGSHLIPALGESWGHASTIRVILYWEGKQRRALLYKSPSMQETAVSYQITVGGIRDVCDQTDRPTDNSSGEDIPQAKRPRVS